ncbi:alpha/beta hydrolase [Hydrogenophaga sp.]|uniref:alpha/beta hydrolase n=1 Tax=Hydrogenophaga sp. TaxID=1904254 RepID=UPI00261CCDCF|nr:alpha/beta hydrolase [Hydrogenophaga sp.]MCW5654776.1 lysophospholipase [Hydrogenophaga sp.]
MSETTQAPFTLRDGLNLALYDWPLPMRWRPRAVILIVHGLGEHAWRYDPVAHRLNEWGFCVRSYDQRGHGESGGARGVLPDDDALLDDLAEVVEDTRSHIAEPWSCPLILLGHSMGGLLAATFVQRGMAPVDGLVLSSPALDPGLGWAQQKLIDLLYRFAPNLAVSNGLNASKISHSAATVEAYKKDPMVHDRISARLAQFIASNGPRVIAAARRWQVPTLLMYAGDDHLVSPQGSRAFAAAAPSDKVHVQAFEGLYHEIFNEADPSAVFGTLKAWLDVHAPAG